MVGQTSIAFLYDTLVDNGIPSGYYRETGKQTPAKHNRRTDIMATFSQAFRPAQNKEGMSRLEFIGHEVKEGKSEKTGKPYAFVNINFMVKGAVRGTDNIISVTVNYTYSDENLLGRTLAAMGYQTPEIEMETDEEGFEVEALADTNEEGFEDVPDSDLGIVEFLENAKGNVYTGKVSKMTEGKRKGFWVIDVDTLKLFKKAE